MVKAKASNPARARKLDVVMPLKAAASSGGQREARAQLKLVGNQKDRGKAQLAALREQIKTDAGTMGGRSAAAKASKDKVKLALAQIRQRFGDPEFKRAVREFNLTFKGIQDVNLVRNVGPGMGPVQ
jgi:hypothetical protein